MVRSDLILTISSASIIGKILGLLGGWLLAVLFPKFLVHLCACSAVTRYFLWMTFLSFPLFLVLHSVCQGKSGAAGMFNIHITKMLLITANSKLNRGII